MATLGDRAGVGTLCFIVAFCMLLLAAIGVATRIRRRVDGFLTTGGGLTDNAGLYANARRCYLGLPVDFSLSSEGLALHPTSSASDPKCLVVGDAMGLLTDADPESCTPKPDLPQYGWQNPLNHLGGSALASLQSDVVGNVKRCVLRFSNSASAADVDSADRALALAGAEITAGTPQANAAYAAKHDDAVSKANQAKADGAAQLENSRQAALWAAQQASREASARLQAEQQAAQRASDAAAARLRAQQQADAEAAIQNAQQASQQLRSAQEVVRQAAEQTAQDLQAAQQAANQQQAALQAQLQAAQAEAYRREQEAIAAARAAAEAAARAAAEADARAAAEAAARAAAEAERQRQAAIAERQRQAAIAEQERQAQARAAEQARQRSPEAVWSGPWQTGHQNVSGVWKSVATREWAEGTIYFSFAYDPGTGRCVIVDSNYQHNGDYSICHHNSDGSITGIPADPGRGRGAFGGDGARFFPISDSEATWSNFQFNNMRMRKVSSNSSQAYPPDSRCHNACRLANHPFHNGRWLGTMAGRFCNCQTSAGFNNTLPECQSQYCQ